MQEKPTGVITLHSETHREGDVESIVGTPEVTRPIELGDKALTTDSIMGVGSIGKMFTKAAVYRLAQEEAIDLNKPAVEYFQEKSPTHEAIRQIFANGKGHDKDAKDPTISDLLNHTSGLPTPKMQDYVTANEQDMSKSATVHKVATDYMNTKPTSKLGEGEYNNINYMIIGQLLEDVTGKESFKDVVHEKVIEPLGLKHTGYVGHASLEGQAIVSPQFRGEAPQAAAMEHSEDKDKTPPSSDAKQTQQALAAGSIFTTANELDIFVREYSRGINGGEERGKNTLFTPKTLEMMHDNVKNGQSGGNYDHKNGQVIELGQAGATSSFGANVQHNPTTGKTNVTMVVAEVSGMEIPLGPAIHQHHTPDNCIFTKEQQAQLGVQSKMPRGMPPEAITIISNLPPENIETICKLPPENIKAIGKMSPEAIKAIGKMPLEDMKALSDIKEKSTEQRSSGDHSQSEAQPPAQQSKPKNRGMSI